MEKNISAFSKPIDGSKDSDKHTETKTPIPVSNNPFMKPIQPTTSPDTVSTPVEKSPKISIGDGKRYSFEIDHLTHIFDKGTEHEFKIFDDFSMKFEDKPNISEVVSIMGGSGCGKSCILKMAAGLMTPQKGDIRIFGQHINEYKSVPMVFQSYSSFHWMTVIDNVALPMVLKGMDKKDAREKAMETLKLVGLEEHASKYANASKLSGGQLQRVSIARCLTSNSKVFFLDEATGALDIKMKREIQDLIIKIAEETEHTIINVTHSLEEALYISNKIFILKPNPCTIFEEMDIDYGSEKRGRWIFDSQKYREFSKHLSASLDEVCK
jgi:NitT/TauT family transport system ATP-binding protein